MRRCRTARRSPGRRTAQRCTPAIPTASSASGPSVAPSRVDLQWVLGQHGGRLRPILELCARSQAESAVTVRWLPLESAVDLQWTFRFCMARQAAMWWRQVWTICANRQAGCVMWWLSSPHESAQCIGSKSVLVYQHRHPEDACAGRSGYCTDGAQFHGLMPCGADNPQPSD